MDSYQDIIHGLRQGQPIREVHRDTGTHRSIIRKLRALSMKQSWLDLSRPIPDLAEISQHFQINESLKMHPLESYHCQIKEWLEKDYSSTVIYIL